MDYNYDDSDSSQPSSSSNTEQQYYEERTNLDDYYYNDDAFYLRDMASAVAPDDVDEYPTRHYDSVTDTDYHYTNPSTNALPDQDEFYYKYYNTHHNDYIHIDDHWFYKLFRLSYNTNTIIIAILSILVFQFQGPIYRLYRKLVARWNLFFGITTTLIIENDDYIITQGEEEQSLVPNESIRQVFVSSVTSLFITIREYCSYGWYTVAEVVRNLVWFLPNLLFNHTNHDYYDDTSTNSNSPNRKKPNNRRNGSNSMPELEDDGVTNSERSKNGSTRNRSESLEPAFVNSNDFPGGWMVYHPVLGVVAKSIADKYDDERKQQQQKQQQQQEQNQLQEISKQTKEECPTMNGSRLENEITKDHDPTKNERLENASEKPEIVNDVDSQTETMSTEIEPSLCESTPAVLLMTIPTSFTNDENILHSASNTEYDTITFTRKSVNTILRDNSILNEENYFDDDDDDDDETSSEVSPDCLHAKNRQRTKSSSNIMMSHKVAAA